MNARNHGSGFRLRLFDETGMPTELRKNLYWVIWASTAGMLGFVVTGGPVWSAFQRQVLGANDFQLGLISAIPFAASVIQIFASYLMEKWRNRRFLFLFFGLLGRSFWILIGLVPYLFPQFNVDLRIWLVVVFVVMVFGGNSFVNVGFGSLMGDLVPMRIRGSYFGARQMFSLASGVIAGLLISAMIDKVGIPGYTIVLILAGVSMLLDVSCFFFVKWPPMPEKSDVPASLFAMIREVFQNKNFVKLIVFYSIWLFAANIAGPFWNIYMLEDLQMSFTQMSLYTQIVSNIATVLVISRWGRLIDRYGNKPIMQMAAIVMVISPLPWFFATPASIGFVLLSNVMGGCSWPVSDLCQQNLYLSHSPQVHRSMYIAVFLACINLFGVALGNAFGGWLMQNPFAALAQQNHVIFGMPMNRFRYLFLATIVLRLLVVIVFLPRISEEGAWTMSAAFKDMLRLAREGYTRRVYLLRTKLLRRKARKMQGDVNPVKKEEE
ncbi:MAG: MFS transporter [Eubacteriales bacterium]|nr:MFS transporter [Eubacteriales bacterium]